MVILNNHTTLVAFIIATFTMIGACSVSKVKYEDVRIAVIVPDDCGPKSGLGEYGVVFSGHEDGTYRSYFAKGTASQLCPLILEQAKLNGRVKRSCLPYDNGIELECIDANVIELNLAESDH